METTRARYRALSDEEQKLAKVIGAKISNTRATIGMSQTELGTLANINQTTISQIETGKRLPNIASLLSIASVLGKDLQIDFLDL